ncbi:MAG: class I SAM-dependent methyltransferase [Phycisphaerales bacterium]|nr:class I SAM-dependent methyltransferase [Phycisphaerales bacterium]
MPDRAAPSSPFKSLIRRAIGRTGYMLVKYRTPQGGFGGGEAAATAAAYAPDMEPEFRELHALCAPFTMTPVERMYNLYIAMRRVLESGIPGDIVECGVWRGGSAMLCALMLARAGESARRVWLYDTFTGMAEPTDKDVSSTGATTREIWEASRRTDHNEWCYASIEDVRRSMASTGLDPARVEFVQGKVEQTLPARAPAAISLLRLDTDWYESTRAELAHLYPRLSRGGVLLVDDYGQWMGQRQAVDEFLAALPPRERPLLARIDQSSRMGIKP